MVHKGARSSLSTLISLIFFYFFLIALMILFGIQVLNQDADQSNLYLAILWFTALVVPVVLLFSIISNVLRLLRERRTESPGVSLKSRLVGYFLLIVLISAIPQAILSMSLLRIVGDSWFNDQVGSGLQSSLDITVSVQQERSESLRSFIFGPLFTSISDRVLDNPARVYNQLTQIRPSVSAFQLFDPEGNEQFFDGDSGARISFDDITDSPQGLVVRDIRGNRSFIRVRRNSTDGSIMVIMEALPEGFAERTLEILNALEVFNQYREIRNLLYTGILVFYGVFSLPLIFLAILTAFYLSDLLIQPIANLEDATRRVAEGDFDFRILTRSREDLGHLVDSFNRMIAELERSREQLMQSERVSAWKDIAQRLAHEIKNPLTPIKLSAERLKRKYEREPDSFAGVLDSSVNTITREVNHLSGLLTEFRDFARMPQPHPRSIPLKELIDAVLHVHSRPSIEVAFHHIDSDTSVFADPDQFRQVLSNLIKNAVEAIGNKPGDLAFSSRLLKASGKQFQRIGVQDNGMGLKPDELKEIFSPYYTTKVDGTGLGLAIVQRIIQDHNGEIRVESEAGNGCRFFIDLPLENS